MLEINDLKIWFIIAVISFVVCTSFIIILVKLMTKKFEDIAPNEKDKKAENKDL